MKMNRFRRAVSWAVVLVFGALVLWFCRHGRFGYATLFAWIAIFLLASIRFSE